LLATREFDSMALLSTTSRSCSAILRRSSTPSISVSARQDPINAIEALREMNRTDARKIAGGCTNGLRQTALGAVRIQGRRH
jgi:hypothetical protein